LAVGLAGLALATSSRRRGGLVLAAAVAAPALLSVSRVLDLVGRAVAPGRHLASEYDLAAHFNWIFKAYPPEALVGAWVALAATAAFVAVWVWRRDRRARAPTALFLALGLLYCVTPKSVSGAWLVHARLPVLVALAGVLLVDVAALPRVLRGLLAAGALASLLAVALLHHRFAQQVEGLSELVSRPPLPGAHGGLSLVGPSLPGERLRFLEHLPQWWTATQGGLGHHFFADADHQPVEFRAGRELPALLDVSDAASLAAFQALLVYGDGALPPSLAAFHEVERAGRWRRLER
jgi:hypothetical protein